jgi:hypothetical protein
VSETTCSWGHLEYRQDCEGCSKLLTITYQQHPAPLASAPVRAEEPTCACGGKWGDGECSRCGNHCGPVAPPAAVEDADPIDTLVSEFTKALRDKLHAAEKKYGWDGAWQRNDAADIRAGLVEHVRKGDPLDVAAFCAFLWHRREPTAVAVEVPDAE